MLSFCTSFVLMATLLFTCGIIAGFLVGDFDESTQIDIGEIPLIGDMRVADSKGQLGSYLTNKKRILYDRGMYLLRLYIFAKDLEIKTIAKKC